MHGEVAVINSPIGELPKFDDLKKLFNTLIDKEYTEELYTKQFSLYIDNIIARIDLQKAAYGKEENIPPTLFEVLDEQRQGLMRLKDKYGPIVMPSQLEEPDS